MKIYERQEGRANQYTRLKPRFEQLVIRVVYDSNINKHIYYILINTKQGYFWFNLFDNYSNMKYNIKNYGTIEEALDNSKGIIYYIDDIKDLYKFIKKIMEQ